MSTLVTLAVDALGGDNAPDVVLDGVTQALHEDSNLSIILCGPEEVVVPFANTQERCEAQVTTEEITMDEHPAQAVRKKKDASIVVACRLVKEGKAQGFFSAGSTGACLAAATLGMGRIKGVMRPALCTVIPSPVKPVVLCDVGANADCKPEYLVQFAQMARIYSELIVGISHPQIALLNIGEEETKGSTFAQESYALLKKAIPEFVGNAEGKDILPATYDVFVTDGFTGNVCLKTIEGTSKTLFSSLKKIFYASALSKLGALTIKSGLKGLMTQVDPDTYGGAPLLGVKGACIVGHGSSHARAIKNGIHTSAKIVRLNISGLIEAAVSDSSD